MLAVVAFLVLPSAAPARAAAPANNQERLGQRVLHLAGGGVLRGSTRKVNDRWEWRGTGSWKTLQSWQVVRVVEERELLREVKARRDDLVPGAEQRVQFWNWMADEGLYAETLEEVGVVLEDAPHAPEACAFLATRDLFVALPQPPPMKEATESGTDELEDYLRFAAAAPPAARELCLNRLAFDAQEAEELFARELIHPSPGRRELAAIALGRLAPGETGRALLSHAIFDRTEQVRLACASSLGAADDPAMTLPLSRALASSSPRISQRAAVALGVAGYSEAVEPLARHLANLSTKSAPAAAGSPRPPAAHIFVGTQRAYLQDFDVEVANGASVADPQINVITGGAVLDVRILGTQTVSLRTRRSTVRHALQRLTGEDFGLDADRWLTWWNNRPSNDSDDSTTSTTSERR
ncbi:MAG: HEAT repeat domain-containing protein [Planctomycetota bacterium]|nr:hypothetical protein [Planctomycetota bacterium]MDP6368164.1 HEAT repeat domain-containing protein [Planctomycetota bacterium]